MLAARRSRGEHWKNRHRTELSTQLFELLAGRIRMQTDDEFSRCVSDVGKVV